MRTIGPSERRDELTQRNEYEEDMSRAPHMSAFGGKADMTIALRNVRL
jgi:hypothetical protein